MIPLSRLLRHLLTGRYHTRKIVSKQSLQQIERSIAESEEHHRGEVRVAIEGALDLLPLLRGLESRQRALDVFSMLRMWDTEENTGILLYVLVAEKKFEIVADRGIDRKVGSDIWEKMRDEVGCFFHRGEFSEGILYVMKFLSELLEEHFPAREKNADELPNRVVIL